jgi:hypothetical protein
MRSDAPEWIGRPFRRNWWPFPSHEPGFPNDRGRAANVVGMTVRENQVPEIARGASELPDRIER